MGHLRTLAQRYGLSGYTPEGKAEHRGLFIEVIRRDEPGDWAGLGHGPYEAVVRDRHGFVQATVRDASEGKALAFAKRVIDAIQGG